MGLRALLFIYVLGGLTFVPLVLLAAAAIFWYTLPLVDQTDGLIGKEEETEHTAALQTKQDGRSPTDGAASATFAVLRRYDFQGATAAFKEAETAARLAENSSDGKTGEASMSVYQSMYRSVFDRNKNAANPMREGEATAQDTSRAKARGKVFYIVLRHGHLMLYDSAVQFEVRHVISLAHYKVSLQDDISGNSELMDAELFAKRTAIVLTSTMTEESVSSSSRKPFYLFCNVNIEKEDFYHALLSSTATPPIPRSIDPELAIKLQSALHSTSLTLEDRALNAVLGRVFLGLHHTPFLESFVREKIEKKMARIAKPGFIASIACHSLDLGDAAPVLSNLKLKDFNITGETVLSLDLKYAGGLNLTIAAVAKLDLGPRFKTRMVTLLLAVVLQRVSGKMLVKIKPPPSSRLWFTFETMPEMELKIEPVVSSRQIKYAFVLRAIEARIREAFAEGLVYPNWDDTPFFNTSTQQYRGGIWESEGQQEAAEAVAGEASAEADDPLSLRNGKTMSSPALTAADSLASGTDAGEFDALKHRTTMSSIASGVSDSAQSAADRAWSTSSSPRPPKSVRSPSLAISKPLVAVDDLSAEPVRSDDPTALPNRRRWIGRTPQAQTLKRDAAEVVRQVRDRNMSRTISDEQELADESQDSSIVSESRRSSEPGAEGVVHTKEQRSMTGFGSEMGPALSGRRDMSHVRNGSQEGTPQRKTILATTAAATNAAKNWTWNAVANRANRQQLWTRGPQRQGSRASTESDTAASSASSIVEPVGRGQPLPPPGMPLPGPQKGMWSAAAAGLGGVRRKPAPKLPARRDQPDSQATSLGQPMHDAEVAPEDETVPTDHSPEGEFGPWMANHDENTLAEHAEPDRTLQPQIVVTPDEAEADSIKPRKRAPPPLPPRRKAEQERDTAQESADTVHKASSHEAGLQNSSPHNPMQLTTVDTLTQERAFQHKTPSHEMADEEHPQSPTPPDLIELDDDHEMEETSMTEEQEHDLEEPLTEADLAALDDDVQAIPAPVDAEAEHEGVLELTEPTLRRTDESEEEIITTPPVVEPMQLSHLNEHLLD